MKTAGKFSWIPRDMLATIGMSAEEKIVWMALNSYTGEDAECSASITHIAERCGSSKSSVQRCLPLMVKAGWLQIVAQASHKPTRYKLLLPTIVRLTIVNETIVDPKKTSQTDEVPLTIPTMTIVNETIVTPPTIVKLNTDYSQLDPLSRTNELEKDKRKDIVVAVDLFGNATPPKPKKGRKLPDVLPEVTEVLDYLNVKIGTKYRVSPDLTARFHQGATVEQAKLVVDHKVTDWQGTDMARYLKPSTLFCHIHFDEYLNQLVSGLPKSARHVNASFPASAYGTPTPEQLEDLRRIQALDDAAEDDEH